MVVIEAVTATGSRWVCTIRASGNTVEQRAELLEVLRRLEQPARPGRPQELEHLEEDLHGPVGVGLVAPAVPAGVRGDLVARLEEHRGEVDRQELDLLVGAVGAHLVHGREERHRRVDHRQRQLGALEPRVGLVGRRPAVARRDRFEALPVRQVAEPGVGRQQVEQVAGARARQAEHDDGRLHRDVEDLGVAVEQPGQAQPGREQPDDQLTGLEAAHRAELAVGLDRRDQGLEGLDEPRVAEVVEALAPHRLGPQLGGVERLVGTDPHRVVQLEEPLGQLGIGQVVDADGLGHRPILTEPGAPRPRASRPARPPPRRGRSCARSSARLTAGRPRPRGCANRRARARRSRRRPSPPRPDQRPAPGAPTPAATSTVVSSARHGAFGGSADHTAAPYFVRNPDTAVTSAGVAGRGPQHLGHRGGRVELVAVQRTAREASCRR